METNISQITGFAPVIATISETSLPTPSTSGIGDDSNASSSSNSQYSIDSLGDHKVLEVPKTSIEDNHSYEVKFAIEEKDSIISSSESSDDEEEVDVKKPKIPDGGWGWMVVFASLIISMIADGISFSFGLLYIEFLTEFNESKSKTSWIGSLFMAGEINFCCILNILFSYIRGRVKYKPDLFFSIYC